MTICFAIVIRKKSVVVTSLVTFFPTVKCQVEKFYYVHNLYSQTFWVSVSLLIVLLASLSVYWLWRTILASQFDFILWPRIESFGDQFFPSCNVVQCLSLRKNLFETGDLVTSQGCHSGHCWTVQTSLDESKVSCQQTQHTGRTVYTLDCKPC